MAIRGAKKKEDKPLYLTAPWKFQLPDVLLALAMKVVSYLARLWNKALAEYLALDEKVHSRLETEVNPLVKVAKEDDGKAGFGKIWLPKNAKISDEKWLEEGVPKKRLLRRKKLKGLISAIFTEEAFKFFGYEEGAKQAKEQAAQAGFGALWSPENAKKKWEDLITLGFPDALVKKFTLYRGLRYDKELMFKHQNGWLTDWRQGDVRRSLEEETLKTLHGAWLSFLMLRAAGDKDSQKPGEREENGFFHTIPNREAFSVNPGTFYDKEYVIIAGREKAEDRLKHKNGLPEGHVIVRLADFLPTLVFLIPKWNKKKDNGEHFYHRQVVQKAINFRQVTMSRRSKESGKSEADLQKPGYFKISLSVNIQKPKPIVQTPFNTVFLAMGGSAIGVVSAKGERVLPLRVFEKWIRGTNREENQRRMSHLRRKLAQEPHGSFRSKQLLAMLREFDEEGDFRGIDLLDDKLSRMAKGSGRWKKLSAIRARKFAKAANRGKDDVHRVTYARKPNSSQLSERTLLWHGAYFVIANLVIRSKPGKVADAQKPERGGPLGPNNRVQSTDRIAKRFAALSRRTQLIGGKVIYLPPPELSELERNLTCILQSDSRSQVRRKRSLRKIFLARRLRDQYLAQK